MNTKKCDTKLIVAIMLLLLAGVALYTVKGGFGNDDDKASCGCDQ